jgi:hypothetical protein
MYSNSTSGFESLKRLQDQKDRYLAAVERHSAASGRLRKLALNVVVSYREQRMIRAEQDVKNPNLTSTDLINNGSILESGVTIVNYPVGADAMGISPSVPQEFLEPKSPQS